jgi:hypothetical protein
MSDLANSVFNKNARSMSADRDPRTAGRSDNYKGDEKVGRDRRKRPHAKSSGDNLKA